MTAGLNSQFAAGVVDQIGAERAHAIIKAAFAGVPEI
jgi:hypothetical protein